MLNHREAAAASTFTTVLRRIHSGGDGVLRLRRPKGRGSDSTLLDPVVIAARRTSDGPGLTASLDHSLWFHRPAVLDDWMLYDQFSASATHGRGLVSAAMFNRSGELSCVVTQEGYLR